MNCHWLGNSVGFFFILPAGSW